MLTEAYEEHRRSREEFLQILKTGISLDELMQEKPVDSSIDRDTLEKFIAADTFEKWQTMIQDFKERQSKWDENKNPK